MLPTQIVIGLGLGWAVGRRHATLRTALIAGSVLSLGWGLLVAFNVWSSDDSSWIAGLIAGILVAVVNTCVGGSVGLLAGRYVPRTAPRTG